MELRSSERFLVRRCLGQGGFGVVYEAHDVQNDCRVALKTLRHFTSDSLMRFKREFRSLAGIAHPNLVQLYELVSDADEWFFTMELVNGRTFIEHVRDGNLAVDATLRLPQSDQITIARRSTAPPSGRADVARLEAALPQLVEGVAALHRAGNIHRDLKPPNVLVTAAGRVVLLDFGLVMAIDAMQSIDVAGTPLYMSPEQAEGRPLTPASDWYSAGLMLFECLTGTLPFAGNFAELMKAKQTDGPPPSEFAAGVPEHLDSLCRDLLQRDETRRPGADEILARLRSSSLRAMPAPARIASTTLFVGREHELRELRAAFDQVLAGDRVTVCLNGPSGIGKSALARRFLDELRDAHPEAVILTGRCFERESVPYKGLDHLIDAIARHLYRLAPQDAEAFLPRDLSALAQLFPVLGQLELASPRRRAATVPDSQELRRRAFTALRELLARIGDRIPTVLFVDDLQWGDVDSADLLTYVLRDPDAPPVLFIASYRSDEVDSSPFLRAFRAEETLRQLNARELALGQLSDEESRELAATLLKPTSPQVTAIARSIAEEAGGSPFFIDELVRSTELMGEDLLQRPDDAVRELTLADMIRPRLDRLPGEAKRLLQLVAVNGQPIPSHVLKRAAAVDAHDAALAVLRMERLIRTRDTGSKDEIETYHDRIRETVVRLLDGDLLQEHHRRLAAAFEISGGDAGVIADHFIAGGEEERALDYTIVAARDAERLLAFDRAARLYRRSLDLLPPDAQRRAQLQIALGNALTNARRGVEAASAYLAVTGLSLRESLELQQKAAQQLVFAGHIDEGLRVLQGVLASVGMQLPKTRWGTLLSLLVGRARLALRGTRFQPRDEAEIEPQTLMRVDACWSVSLGLGTVDTMHGAVFQTRHAIQALDAGELHRVARAMCLEFGYSSVRGSASKQKTEKLMHDARELVDRADTPYASGLFKLCAGIVAFCEGRWRTGADWCLAAEPILLDGCTGVTWELDSARFYSFLCHLFLGEMKTMAARYPLLIQDAQERGDRYALSLFRGMHSHFIHLCADDPSEARDVLRDAIGEWQQTVSQAQYVWEMWAGADIALYERRGSAAWTRVQQSWPALEDHLVLHVQFNRVNMNELRGRCALAAMDDANVSGAESRRLLREAERAARRIERQRTDWGGAMAELLRAGIELRRGRKIAALRHVEAAEQRFSATDMNLHRAVAQRRRGELTGGAQGEALIASSEAWMRSEGIRNPERLAYMYAPWNRSS